MISIINPFVRYVSKSTYFIDAKVVAPDCRMLYIISGNGRFETGGIEYPLSSGVLVYYPAGTPYQIHSNQELLFYTLNFDMSQDFAEKYPTPFSPRRGDVCDKLLFGDSDPSELSSFLYLRYAQFADQIIGRIYEESIRPTEYSAMTMSACLKLLLVDILRYQGKTTEHPLVSRIKELVTEDLCCNNLHLAKILGYHPYYLNEIFSREEGISLHKYIMKERIAKARELITSSNNSLSEIAEQCGFSSQSHLSRCINAEYGITPSKMRKTQ